MPESPFSFGSVSTGAVQRQKPWAVMGRRREQKACLCDLVLLEPGFSLRVLSAHLALISQSRVLAKLNPMS